ncbi:MAG: hypothetical protein EP332_07615 [Bacteroidetes bacterium]|nr:MAG: hypothetical protein EP332_07615 [Bacteroidota bacterium]
MKLKGLVFSCIILLSAVSTAFSQGSDSSQTSSKRKFLEHQIGLDATIFIQNFTFNGGGFVGSPYALNYKLLYQFKKGFIQSAGLRTGLGYTRMESSSENIIQKTSNENKSLSYRFRVGIEAQKRINKHWVVYLGYDYVVNESNDLFKNSFKSGNNTITTESNTKMKSEGSGLALGVQFNFNKHISLGTELSVYDLKGTSETISQSGNNIPQVNKTTLNSTQIITPAFVNFIVRF